jgi:tetratricopeptide (TPR) repeat protein
VVRLEENILKLVFLSFRHKEKQSIKNEVKQNLVLDKVLNAFNTDNTPNPIGENLYHNGRFEEAIEIFNRNIDIYEDDIRSLYYKGLCLFKIELYMEGLSCFVLVNSRQEGYLEVKENIVVCKEHLKDDWYDLYYSKGYNFYKSSEFRKAIDYLTKASYIKPDRNTYKFIARSYLGLKEYEKALEYYQKDGDAVEVYYNIARVYYEAGGFEEAIQSYTKAIEICPSFYQAYIGKGNVYGKLNRYDEAFECYKIAIEISTKSVGISDSIMSRATLSCF